MILGLFLPIAALLGLFALLALRFLYDWFYRFADRTAQEVIPYLLKIDIAEVKGLFNPEEEKYLKLNLPEKEFRKAQWKRCRLAQQFVRNISHNARIIQEWGKFERVRSRKTRDAAMRRSALELNILCAQCRICALAVQIKLRWWTLKMAVLPVAPPSFLALVRLGSLEMISFYEKMQKRAAEVGGSYGESYQSRLAQVL